MLDFVVQIILVINKHYMFIFHFGIPLPFDAPMKKIGSTYNSDTLSIFSALNHFKCVNLLMSSLNHNKVEYQRISNGSSELNHRDTFFININDSNNPFEQKKSWEDFKKEYYQLEKKIKKSLENLHLIQIEFTKHLSLIEYILPYFELIHQI